MGKKSRGKQPLPQPSQTLVAGRGFREDGALIAHDGSPRYFAEVWANTDRPEVRPYDAFAAIIHALPTGWAVRFLQVAWPDTSPRRTFIRHIHEQWQKSDVPLRETLREALVYYLEGAPLPFYRRTVLEISPPPNARPEQVQAMLQNVAVACEQFHLQVRLLSEEEVAEIARYILNPEVS